MLFKKSKHPSPFLNKTIGSNNSFSPTEETLVWIFDVKVQYSLWQNASSCYALKVMMYILAITSLHHSILKIKHIIIMNSTLILYLKFCPSKPTSLQLRTAEITRIKPSEGCESHRESHFGSMHCILKCSEIKPIYTEPYMLSCILRLNALKLRLWINILLWIYCESRFTHTSIFLPK